jgi:predicted nucleic acid-binding protein
LDRRRIYVDSNVLIAIFESGVIEQELISRLFAADRPFSLITSELVIGEVVVGPLRARDAALEAAYLTLLENPATIALIPISRDILWGAARLRSISSMKLPDAIHVATATAVGCEALLSFDKRLYTPPPLVRLDPTPIMLQQWSEGS